MQDDHILVMSLLQRSEARNGHLFQILHKQEPHSLQNGRNQSFIGNLYARARGQFHYPYYTL